MLQTYHSDDTVEDFSEQFFNKPPGLKWLQSQVGGWIQCVGFPTCLIIMNEEGKMRKLPYNTRATAVFHFHGGDKHDYVVGDVVIVTEPHRIDGEADEH